MPSSRSAYQRRWYLANSDRAKANNTRWKSTNRKRVNAWARAKYWENIEATRRTEAARACVKYAKNPGKGRAVAAKYRADKKRATPPWADPVKIGDVYQAADRISKATGTMHDVDHIIPLRGKYVSGLHCEDNLRVMEATGNRSKGNKFDPQAIPPVCWGHE